MLGLVLALLLLSGCGGGNPRQAVSGTVTFKNQPLDQGTISFEPASPEVKSSGGAPITNGNYSIAANNGLLPGQYKVRISSGDAKAVDTSAPPGESGPPAKERIPPEFNANTKLTFEVKAGQSNVFDVDIP